jgi:hypothetical protein
MGDRKESQPSHGNNQWVSTAPSGQELQPETDDGGSIKTHQGRHLDPPKPIHPCRSPLKVPRLLATKTPMDKAHLTTTILMDKTQPRKTPTGVAANDQHSGQVLLS